MRLNPPCATSLINADLGCAGASSVRIVGSVIQSIGENAAPGDLVIDLRGDRLLPGLINAHDHLQLNGFRRLKYRDLYANVRGWIDDVASRRSGDADLLACQAVPLRARQVHGGLKNIISGVTTVAHHDPMHTALLESGFPTRVVANMGWSHSLQIDGEATVRRSHRDTPPERPWATHAAEGTDAEAAQEFARLDALGCIAGNTLIVHGVAMDSAQRERLASAGAGLIWCPSSNMHLFGTTVDVSGLATLRRVALGTDSRMSGERDLLAEIRVARSCCELGDLALEGMVTSDAAGLLRLEDRGALLPGRLADLVVLPARAPLHKVSRADVRFVMLDGRIRLGDAHYLRQWAPRALWAECVLDGRSKLMDPGLATLITELEVHEPGLEMNKASWRAA